MHVFGVVVWLGGLMFQNAVALPIVQFETDQARSAMRKVNRRFVGFVWMSAWTIFVTGAILMLLSPRFFWFEYHDQWSVLLGCKQIIFLLMVIYAFGYARMLTALEKSDLDPGVDGKREVYGERLNQFRKMSIFLGIVAILLAMAM